jgi:hypothetical protein
LSNSTSICPSGQCEVKTGGELTGFRLLFDEPNSNMAVFSDFRLQDDATNGHFTPKKQNLVEKMYASFVCIFADIIEEKGTTKYICGQDSGSINRTFNSTFYRYDFSSSFELPSMRFVMNATES